MGVATEPVALELLPGSEGDGAVHPERITILGHHDIRGAAAVKILADGGVKFVGHPHTQGFTDVDVLAGDLHLHAPMNAPVTFGCQAKAGGFAGL